MLTEIREAIDRVYRRTLWCDILEGVDWGPGVALYGVIRANQAVENPALAIAERWTAAQVKKYLTGINVNTSALGLSLTYLYGTTGNESFLRTARRIAEYLMNEAPRVGKGAIEHTVIEDDWSGQVWADTLFMGGLFLGRFGKYTENPALVEESARQFALHMEYLSAGEGLFYHGWNEDLKSHMSAAKWARGNGWITASAAELLTEILPHTHELYLPVKKYYTDQVRRLMDLQDPATGFWHTLLDRQSSYLETSASCAFAYGILKGIRHSLLPETYLPSLLKTIKHLITNQIDEQGTVLGVSTGTNIQPSVEDYNAIPAGRSEGWGQGLALLLLSEWLLCVKK